MAIIKIPEKIIFDALTDALRLSNPIEALVAGPGDTYTILTKIDGFESSENVNLIYGRDDQGKTYLIRQRG